MSSEPAFATLGRNHLHRIICRICASIPFDRLPSEEEAAYPHHATLDDLRSSSSKCALCALLIQSINEQELLLKSEKHRSGALIGDFAASLQAQGYSNPVISYVESVKRHQDVRLLPDRKSLEVLDLGRRQSATFENVNLAKYGVVLGGPSVQPPQPPGVGTLSRSTPRPWIYGNWWLLDQPDESSRPAQTEDYYRPQLLGIGVRLTELPTPHACKMYDRQVVHRRGSSIRIFTELGDPTAQYIPGRIRELFSGSLKSRDLIRFWVRKCNAGHNCQQKEPPVLPTRVLDVGSPPTIESVRLWETNGAKGHYIALSHSWGGADILTTKAHNLRAHKSAIPLEYLPQTFYDTVRIAYGLGIRYVWIDSLCIIQGDKEDWEREAPKMSNVYHNAYLTVSASHALNALEGCFPRFRMFKYTPMDNLSTGISGEWDYLDFVPVDASTSFRRRAKLYFHKGWMPPSSIKSPTVYRNGNFGDKCDPISLEMLSSRAWTLQERLLSPRILHFGRDQMYWECQRCFMAEDGSRFDPTTFSLEQVIQTQTLDPTEESKAQYLAFTAEAKVENSWEEGRFKGGWPWVVTDFSRRRLTVPDDKLPALSGLASIIAARTGDTYMCGLWKRHICHDLCWKVDRSQETEMSMRVWDMRLEPSEDLNKPNLASSQVVFRDASKPLEVQRVPGRAPSWSWASMDAPVQFEQIQGNFIVARLVSHEIQPLGKDKHGRVSSGFIVLHAPLVPMTRRDLKASTEWIRTSYDSRHPFETPVQIFKDGEIAPGFATFDVQEFFPCFAAFIDSACALVLKASSAQNGEFQRIGLATFIRTQSQKNSLAKGPDAPIMQSSKHSQGPIQQSDERSFVRIV